MNFSEKLDSDDFGAAASANPDAALLVQLEHFA